MPGPASQSEGRQTEGRLRRMAWVVALVLVLTLSIPATGMTDHADDHSGRCFAPTSTQSGEEVPPLADWTIAVDPGHGGDDPGALSGELTEEVLVLDISDRLREQLRASGAEVCQTRTGDEFLSRNERAEFANRNGADLLVSIHLNSFDDPEVNYTMTMWYSRLDRRLAESVLGTLADELVQTVDGDAVSLTPGRETQFNSGMLRDAEMPAIIVEGAFMSNTEEAERLRSGSGRQEQIATAVHDGIVAYATEDRPILIRASVSLVAPAVSSVHRLQESLVESAAWSVRRVASGYHATAGRDQLSLVGIDFW